MDYYNDHDNSISEHQEKLIMTKTIENTGEPILLNTVQINGLSATSAHAGETVSMITRLSVTSDEKIFHPAVESFCSHIAYCLQREGKPSIDLENAKTILLVIKESKISELWVDTAAVALRCITNSETKPYTVIFKSQIADIIEMYFPCVNIEKTDAVVCIFRLKWRFGLFFDFNPEKNLSVKSVNKSLGALHRRMEYYGLYDAISENENSKKLQSLGWFPFAELIPNGEYMELINFCDEADRLSKAEEELLTRFDKQRLDKILNRWMENPFFSSKKAIFKEAFDAFQNKMPVSTIKIILTEIEGVLRSANYSKTSTPIRKLDRLRAFAIDSAIEKTGSGASLMFASEFDKYLQTHTFTSFDPAANVGNANSRHAIGHGAADPESYNMIRALQAILTLDQIRFFL